MENKNRLFVMGLVLVFLMIVVVSSVFNYRLSKQMSGIGKAETAPVSDPKIQQQESPAPAKKTTAYKAEGFDYDPLAPVFKKAVPVAEKAPQEESVKKVFDAVPGTQILVQ